MSTMESMPVFKGDGVIVAGKNVAITRTTTQYGVELLTVYEREEKDGFYMWFMVYCAPTVNNTGAPQSDSDANEERVREWNIRARR